MSRVARPLIVLGILTFCLMTGMASGQPVVMSQAIGPLKANGYLLYDEKSREAALFDVGGPIDELVAAVSEKGLTVKYIFITHAHQDHVLGLPAARDMFPEAKVCFSREESDVMESYERWEEKFPPQDVAQMKMALEAGADPAFAALLGLDYDRVGKPDVFVADGQAYKLGGFEVRAILSPGHSAGSLCYSAPGVLFSGDVLFAGTVGKPDPAAGGKKAVVKSVRRLYKLLPDETKVYPGHRAATDIGTEKKENKWVSATSVNLRS